jgi:hypothetical protein
VRDGVVRCGGNENLPAEEGRWRALHLVRSVYGVLRRSDADLRRTERSLHAVTFSGAQPSGNRNPKKMLADTSHRDVSDPQSDRGAGTV